MDAWMQKRQTPRWLGSLVAAMVFGWFTTAMPSQAADIPATYKWRAVSGTDPSCESTPTPSTCYDSAAAACQHYWGTYYLGFRLDNPPWNNYAYCQYRNIYGDPAWAFTWGNAIADLFCPVGYRLASYSPTCSPVCGPNQQFLPDANNGAGACVDKYKLSLTPDQATIEPGKSYTFTARVTDQDGNPPTISVPVSVKVEVAPTSGGHDHGETYATRNKGSISPTNGTTSFLITFTATEVSGTHTITATCDLCSNSPQTAKVDVKVEGLEIIPSSPFYTFIGETDKHTDNHYLTLEAAAVLWRIAVSYQVEQQFKLKDPATGKFTVTPPVLHVNDAGLAWGGLFDIYGKWASPHVEHRRGTVVDIRANTLPTAIPAGNLDEFILLAVYYGADAFLETPSAALRHFHLRLLNREE